MFDDGVTIGTVRTDIAAVAAKMEARHGGDKHDTLVVFVPPGSAAEAVRRIWAALDTAPVQTPAEFERDQALAHDDNIRRMYGGF